MCEGTVLYGTVLLIKRACSTVVLYGTVRSPRRHPRVLRQGGGPGGNVVGWLSVGSIIEQADPSVVTVVCSIRAYKMAISSLPHNSSDFLYLLFFAIHILVLLGLSFSVCLCICLSLNLVRFDDDTVELVTWKWCFMYGDNQVIMFNEHVTVPRSLFNHDSSLIHTMNDTTDDLCRIPSQTVCERLVRDRRPLSTPFFCGPLPSALFTILCCVGVASADATAAFDLVPLYPDAVTPQALTDLQNYYIETYQDRFFADPPLWFRGFTLGEGLYQLPLSIWAVRALLRSERPSDQSLPLHDAISNTVPC